MSDMFQAIPFPCFELQSKWIAGILSGRIVLPSQEEMMEDVKAFYSELEASGKPKRYTHIMDHPLFEYTDWLAAQCNFQGYEEWRKQMAYSAFKNIFINRPGTYRNEWDDEHLVAEANKDFIKYTLNKSK